MNSANYGIAWDSVNSGGEDTSSSTNFGLRDTYGEQATGDSSSTSFTDTAGYRVGDEATSTPFTPPPSGGGGGGTVATPPVIYNIKAINITTSTAQITWQTDLYSNSTVNYGLTNSYSSGTATDGTFVITHSLQLVGLTPGTLYHFRVSSTDSFALTATSGDNTFATLAGPASPAPALTITVPQVSNILDTSALVTWSSNLSASSLVSYGTSTNYGATATVPGFSTAHSVGLNGLVPGTLYHFFVTSADGAGRVATSSDDTFTTTNDTTAPANVNSLTVIPGDSLNNLSWNNPTDPDFAGVRIVRKTGTYPSGPFDGTLVYNSTGTNTVDSGLVNGVTYYYAAYAYDTNGNFASGALGQGTPNGAVTAPPTTTSTSPVVPPASSSTSPTSSPGGSSSTTPVIIVTPPGGGSGSVGQINAFFTGNGGTVALEPDANGQVGVLANSAVSIRIPSATLGGIPTSVTLQVGGSLYSLQRSSDGNSYVGSFVIPTVGHYPGLVQIALQGGTILQRHFTFNAQSGGEVLEATTFGTPQSGVSGAQVQLFQNVNGVWVPYTQATTGPDGTYAFIVPNGSYYAHVSKVGYRDTETPPFTITQNVFNGQAVLIPIPVLQAVSSTAPLTQKASVAFSNFGKELNYGVEIVRSVFASPQVQAANAVAAPTLLALALLNIVSAVSFFNLLAYLQYLFTQPILLFGRRKKKKWGIVYNSLTKQPVDLAIVRLLSADTKFIVQTKVTDKYGRYAFLVKAGNYLIEVVKPGYVCPTQYLANKTEDLEYLELYHGEKLSFDKADEVVVNIPLDPITREETPRMVIFRKALRKFQTVAAFSGIPLGMCVLIISPSLAAAFLLLAQIGIFLLFRRLSVSVKAKNWGITFDAKTRKPVDGVIVRIFDKKFNKLLETQVTDRNGKYGFLVRRSVYYLTAEKSGFKKYTSPTLDLEKQDESLIDQPIALERL